MADILKGNYKAPIVEDTKTQDQDENTPEQKNEDKLKEEFEAAALKKLGGSIAFVKKPGSKFVWGIKEDGKGDKNE